MRRNIAGLAIAGLLLASACGSSASPAPSTPAATSGTSAAAPGASAAPVATVTLTLRYCWGGEGEVKAMEKVIQAWNSAHPEIQVRGISGNIKTEEIAAAVAGGAPPDMVIMCDNGAIAGFAHDKVILPLDDILAKIGANTSDIIPASLKWTQYQGKQYGLPFGQDTWALYYNTDMFTAAGLDPTKPPTTPDQLWADAAKLTKLNADGSLAVAGFIPDDPDRNLESTSNLFNCQFYDEATKKITVNSPECVAWFNWYKKWYDTYNKGNAMVNLISTRTGGDAGLMQTGQLAMAIYGEWENGAAYLSTNAPNLKYDTAPIPAINPDKYGAAFINGNAWFIPTGSTNPEAAAKFGMYLMTDDPSRTMDIQNASVPQLTSLLTDPVLTAIPHQKTFLSLVNHKDAWTTPMISVYGQIKDGLGSALSAVTTGGVDAQKALNDLATEMQAKLDANGP
ncbi:MAG TPA: extracellular solute-binding protein [Candidatus Limnocylindrales bacterium]|jgi:multiple sugar transport system substrate-binding protein|nr:extracellular solute-binding protein [Candidatus Limnocylindrales bacterium]